MPFSRLEQGHVCAADRQGWNYVMRQKSRPDAAEPSGRRYEASSAIKAPVRRSNAKRTNKAPVWPIHCAARMHVAPFAKVDRRIKDDLIARVDPRPLPLSCRGPGSLSPCESPGGFARSRAHEPPNPDQSDEFLCRSCIAVMVQRGQFPPDDIIHGPESRRGHPFKLRRNEQAAAGSVVWPRLRAAPKTVC
jgi:hypothetical protein